MTSDNERALEDFEQMLRFIELTNMSNGTVMNDFLPQSAIKTIKTALQRDESMPERISLKTLNWMLADVPTGGEAAFLMDNFKNGLIIIDDQKQVKP